MVSRILGQILPHLKYRVGNNIKFLERLKNININKVQFMASFDIENMFPNMPTNDDAIKVIKSYLHKFEDIIDLLGFSINNILKLLRFLFDHTYVQYDGSFYKQKNGVGTGIHSSPSYSEIIVDHIYGTVIEKTGYMPDGLSLYMDDGWMAWTSSREAFNTFYQELNNVYPGHLAFTFETADWRINFLDLTVIRTAGGLEHEFYQKDTHSGTYLDYFSHCPEKTKINIIKSETRRIINNCSQEESIWSHLENLRAHLLKSNYPIDIILKHMIATIRIELNPNPHPIPQQTKKSYEFVYKIPYVNEGFTRIIQKTIDDLEINARVVPVAGISTRNIIKKEKTNYCGCQLCEVGVMCTQKHAVYKATCYICSEAYIGVSNRQIVSRMKEHERGIRLNYNNSVLGQHYNHHFQNEDPVPILSDDPDYKNMLSMYKVQIIDRGSDSIESYIREGLQIAKQAPTLNTKLSNGWVR